MKQPYSFLFFLFIVVWGACLNVSSALSIKNPPFLIHTEAQQFFINKDGTGSQKVSTDIEILTPEGITLLTTYTIDYDPELKELEIKEAYVLQPDGSKIVLGPDNIFTRPSLASAEAPGFVNTLTTSLVFPDLQVGSHIIYNIEGKIKKWGPFGFSWIKSPHFFIPQKNFSFELNLPLKKDFFLEIDQKGELYRIEDKENSSKKMRTVRVSFKDWPGLEAEPDMINPTNWLPYFIVTPFKTWAEVGNTYYKEAAPQIIINDAIKKLALSLVDGKKGKEAAKILYDWVAQNITYVSISLDPLSFTKPHSSIETLQKKYGDCKDKTALLQALLKAVDIDSISVLINLNNSFKDFPILPFPFFNHAIIYLPQYAIFADPTNRFAAFGDLSSTLYDAPIILVSSNSKKGFLPSLQPQKHLYKVTTNLSFSPEGTLHGQNMIKTTGPAASDHRSFFFNPADTPEQRANNVLSLTPEGGAGTMTSENIYTLNPSFSFSGNWKTPKIINMEESTSFLIPYGTDPRLSLPFLRNLFTNTPRKYPFQMTPGIDIWEYTITPPSGYTFSQLPKNRSLETPSATYQSTYTIKNNTLHVLRKLKVINSLIHPSQNSEIMDPIELFLLDLRQPIFLRKN